MTKEKGAPAPEDVFDISALESTDTAILEILHPGNGEPSGWKWTIAGPAHPVTIEQGNRLSRKIMQDARTREMAQVNGRKWKPEEKTPEEQREENARLWAERVLDWTPIKIRGNDLPFSNENVVKVLLDPKLGTVYSQLLEFLKAEQSFTQGSAQNS